MTHTSAPAAVLEAAADVVKPRLRGWLHAAMFPLTVIGGIVLVALSSGTAAHLASVVYAASACLLFGVSALYHRRHWEGKAALRMRRFDHSNINLIIAGTYTPLVTLALTGTLRTAVLVIVWSAALGGVAFRVLWTSAPRWLYTPLYVLLGGGALGVSPQLIDGGGVGPFVLVCVGGLFYIVGALIYGFKWPNTWPRTFGFHEFFHAATILGFVLQYIAVSIVVYMHR